MIRWALTSGRTDWTNPDNSPRIGKRWFRFFSNFRGIRFPGLTSSVEKEGILPRFLIPHSSGHGLSNLIPGWTQISCYGQAIKGVGDLEEEVGIIDTIFILMEVAESRPSIASAESLNSADLIQSKPGFTDYLNWILHHIPTDRRAGTWPITTASAGYASAVRRTLEWRSASLFCREMYKTQLLPDQMAADASFPLELARTKALWLFTFYPRCNDHILFASAVCAGGEFIWIQIWKRKKHCWGFHF